MCGILGSFVVDPLKQSVLKFERGLEKLRHRGPDDKGVKKINLCGSELTLGHTRLSIIDLSLGGHQPRVSKCGRYTLVFNGEIFNYRELRNELREIGFSFQSESDTEVLLAAWIAWGQGCLTRLIGMFAFVIFDRVEVTLYCARDSFGIKPFFYCQDHGSLYFGSEIPAIIEISEKRLTPNYQSGYDYLVSGLYDKSSDTFFDGVKQLLPGHLLYVKLDEKQEISTSRWFWPNIEQTSSLSYQDAAERLRALFLESVRLHLRSDVPVGAALSGGLDSSAIVCAMRYIEPRMPIHTFSFVDRSSRLNEEHWIDVVNASCDAIPHKVQITHDNWISDLDDLIFAQGEPFGSTSIYAQYCVYRHAKELGVTVTLDGQGADELLAGYSGFPAQRMLSMFSSGQPIDALRFLAAWREWPGRSISSPLKQLLSPLVPAKLLGLARKLDGREPLPDWINSKFVDDIGIDRLSRKHELSIDIPSGRHLMNTLRNALTGYGLNELLRHGDRNSMRWSVESRVPFLNPNIAHFLLSLPEEYLISNQGETKHIFRTAMQGIVPEEILMRRDKIGFESPETEWLVAARLPIERMLQTAGTVPILDATYCKRLISGFMRGDRKNNSRQAWRIINYIRWHNAFFQ
jgi:asparagine synthase (glutamine-hydrolysing)